MKRKFLILLAIIIAATSAEATRTNKRVRKSSRSKSIYTCIPSPDPRKPPCGVKDEAPDYFAPAPVPVAKPAAKPTETADTNATEPPPRRSRRVSTRQRIVRKPKPEPEVVEKKQVEQPAAEPAEKESGFFSFFGGKTSDEPAPPAQ